MGDQQTISDVKSLHNDEEMHFSDKVHLMCPVDVIEEEVDEPSLEPSLEYEHNICGKTFEDSVTLRDHTSVAGHDMSAQSGDMQLIQSFGTSPVVDVDVSIAQPSDFCTRNNATGAAVHDPKMATTCISEQIAETGSNVLPSERNGTRTNEDHLCGSPTNHLKQLSDRPPMFSDAAERFKAYLIEGYYCYLCWVKFGDSHTLCEHLNSMHPDRPKGEFTCDYCGKTLKAEEAMATHTSVVHKTTKAYTAHCKYCAFAVPGSFYAQHVLVVHNEKPCTDCGICGMSLHELILWHHHMRDVHNIEKPFRCSFCPTFFRSTNHKHSHERTHTGDKPFPCHICNRWFSQSRTLRGHMLDSHKLNVFKPLNAGKANKWENELEKKDVLEMMKAN